VNLLRRLIPARQSSRCAGCDTPIIERRRRPCPRCGSRNRVIRVGWHETPVAHHRAKAK
jgi:hypothetical protein